MVKNKIVDSVADAVIQAGYGEQDYASADDSSGHDGYADEPGYPGQGGYPAGHNEGYSDDTGFQAADDYLPGRDQPLWHREGIGERGQRYGQRVGHALGLPTFGRALPPAQVIS